MSLAVKAIRLCLMNAMPEKLQCVVLIAFFWIYHNCFSGTQAETQFWFDGDNEGHRLHTVVLRKLRTLSGPECVLHCFNDNCCRSVNFNKRCFSLENINNCELLHGVASEQPTQLKLDENFDHYYLLKINRDFSCNCVTCGKNEKCFEEYKNCSCRFGFDRDKCAEANLTCESYDWWNSNYDNTWTNCPTWLPFITGLNRTKALTPNEDRMTNVVGMKCCNVGEINATTVHTECINDRTWKSSFDRPNSWSECPPGFFLNGLRNSRQGLSAVDEAKCCKFQEFPHSYSNCYDEEVMESFYYTQQGMSHCSKEKYLITGLYKASCDKLHCMTKFRCCRMEYI